MTNAADQVPVIAPRALIADDDPVFRLLLANWIGRLGFHTEQASDGLQALDFALGSDFDLIVLDVLMPGADGFEVCQALRALPRYRLTPILMATGLDDHASVGRAFDAGASDFERKPLNQALLNHRIRFLMKSAQTVRDLEHSREVLDRLATHDMLTGLPNRSGLTRRMSNSLATGMANGTQTGVLYIDLDGFKNVNDSLGHPFGDRLLRAIVARMQATLPADSMLARIGGDEFLIVADALDGQSAAEAIGARILAALEAPLQLDQYEFRIGASIGICMHPTHGSSADELIRNADLAMYRAKQTGRRRCQMFDEALMLGLLERVALRTDLRRAIAESELELLYQPIVELATARIIGAEALLRWNHPTRGEIPASVFVPIAEESGMLAEIGQWVVERAAIAAARWCRQPFGLGHVAVNVSGPEIWRADFVERVRRTIAAAGVAPAHIRLEITETLAMEQASRGETLHALEALRASGMTIAIDDFGTARSSLPHLQRLPVSTLKLDGSLVRAIDDAGRGRMILHAIVALGSSLGLELIAEGIEHPQQRDWLIEEGCALGQGHLFSAPLDAAGFEALLREARPVLSHPAPR